MILEEEKLFYRDYGWALLPFQSLEQILLRLSGWTRNPLSSDQEWCRRERLLNAYLLSAAVLDILDEFLGRSSFNFSRIGHLPLMARPCRWAAKGFFYWDHLNIRIQKDLRAWRRNWSAWLIQAGERLIENLPPGGQTGEDFGKMLEPLLQVPLPKALLRARAKIPAAFRSQDLSHFDFLALGEKYLARHTDRSIPQVVVGLRTAGSYIAPLISALLRKRGWAQVSFMTLRPKENLACWDALQLKSVLRAGARWIIVDEPPSTGKTLSQSLELLEAFSVRRRDVTLLVPVHPAGRNWLDLSGRRFWGEAEIITLEPEDWYKEKVLSPERFLSTVKPYFEKLGFSRIQVEESEEVDRINQKLIENPGQEFHVRLKRVFQVAARNGAEAGQRFLVMAKSAGWGWLGYHAALAAEKIADHIPVVYGVRDGILYQAWMKNGPGSGGSAAGNGVQRQVGDYICQRAREFKLAEDPTEFLGKYRNSGLQAIAIILSNAFGPKISKLKRGWTRKMLEKEPRPWPVWTDSRMMKSEWVFTEKGFLKSDFEHHGFSKTASHNIVDPAYDLAAAMMEFGFSGQEQRDLIRTYIEKTGDAGVEKRLIYYEILAGTEAMHEALSRINQVEYSAKYPEANEQYIRAWNFLVAETSKQAAALCRGKIVNRWSSPWFVMDIDDVLDQNIFGYPSTTAKGVRALSLLRSHGACSVINTARSLDEVVEYCRNYGFSGGVAEYGSVLWDALEQKAQVLISPEAEQELAVMRQALTEIPGVFINPGYRYSIRAYSFNRERTTPVLETAIGLLFRKYGIRSLKAKRSYIDTAICDRAVDKGTALRKLKELKGGGHLRVGAIGDSEADLPMLAAADMGLLVGNSTAELQRKAELFGIKRLGSSFQSGLLEGVLFFLHGGRGGRCPQCRETNGQIEKNSGLLWKLMQIADLSRKQQWMRLFDRQIFEFFRE